MSGWGKVGKKLKGERSGKRCGRTSVIAALNANEIKASMHFTGYTDTTVFLYWLEHFLIPILKPGQAVILDNASFHKNKKIVEMIETAGCKVLFLPPYSPDLNKIEHYWAILKKYLAKIKHQFPNFLDAVDYAMQKTILMSISV